jgi:hypothetical protein
MSRAPKCRADLIALGQTLRRRLNTLFTLGDVNDPWMADADYRSAAAHWVARIFERLGIRARVHVRQVHYRLVSQETPILRINGEEYVNSGDCFNHLCDAIRDARYLGLISSDLVVDRRNPEPVINHVADGGDVDAKVGVSDGEIKRHPFGPEYKPPEIELPVTWLHKPEVGQGYHLEIWIEKSTANDILLPLGREYGINIVTFIGEASATACKNLVDRAIESGKPVRILHVTDFDPAGRDMPISAAVKIDFFAKQSDIDLDIRLEHVALTPEQCIQYQLPRTPIKQTEGRITGFQTKYGEGATELDALQALYPGALRDILVEHIDRYYDHDLRADVENAVERFSGKLWDADAEVEKQFSKEIADFNRQRDEIAAAFKRQTGPAREAYDRILRLAQARYDRALDRAEAEITDMEERLIVKTQAMLSDMEAALEEAMPDPDLFDWPEPAEGDEDDDALYDSTRDYVEQVDVYRAHRGDDENVGLAIDRVVTKTCQLCGESFSFSESTVAKKRKFCSSKCTNKSYRNSVRARRDASPLHGK